MSDFRIAFAALSPGGTGQQDLLVLGINGLQAGDPVDLTRSPAGYFYPTWSPDGSQIAFVRRKTTGSSAGDIYVIGADGSDIQRVTQVTTDYLDLSWSPDGTKITCTFESTFMSDVYVMDVTDGVPVSLTSHGDRANDVMSQWSPDGTKIAFIRGLSRYEEIVDFYVMDSDGTNPVNLTWNESRSIYFDWRQAPSWSPDGTQITFSSGSNGNREVFVADADGENLVNLTDHPSNDIYPSWSPDGTKIAFVRDKTGTDLVWTNAVYVMDADGSSPVPVTSLAEPITRLAWSPDGTRVVFSSFNGDLFWVQVSGQVEEAVRFHLEGFLWWSGFSVAP